MSDKLSIPENFTAIPKGEPEGGHSPVNIPQQAFEFLPSGLLYDLHTIWLFPVTEFDSVIIPSTVFSILCSLSGKTMTANVSPDLETLFFGAFKALVWAWLNILIFTIANQRLPRSIIEDTINKSWRPFPAKRISSDGARKLLLMFAIPATALMSLFCGAGTEEMILSTFLQYLYNDLGGADEHWVIRNLLNAGGLWAWNLGCTKIVSFTLGQQLNATGHQWLNIIGLVIFTTMQLQDFRDAEGDLKIGRRTLPLIWGDSPVRYITSLVILGWSLFCPAYWSATLPAFLITTTFGMVISCRLLLCRNKKADHHTWKLWGFWLISLYFTPIFHRLDAA